MGLRRSVLRMACCSGCHPAPQRTSCTYAAGPLRSSPAAAPCTASSTTRPAHSAKLQPQQRAAALRRTAAWRPSDGRTTAPQLLTRSLPLPLLLPLQTAAATSTVATAVAGASKAMGAMQAQLNPQKMSATMQQFAKENAKMEMTSEMMNDTIDDALDDDAAEEETNELVDQVGRGAGRGGGVCCAALCVCAWRPLPGGVGCCAAA